jgi:signal transduction histidine kinase
VLVPDDIITIIADEPRLWQVIDNLVSNAIKYNKEGGAITIRAAQQGDSILISVEDTGIGISSDDQGHVFDRFFRAVEGVRLKIEGTGLGLAITKSIVERHRGRIWVESQLDVGSTFYVSLPIWQDVGEGSDGTGDMTPDRGEGNENRKTQEAVVNSEERDAVNDDVQESREMTQVDSAVDEI